MKKEKEFLKEHPSLESGMVAHNRCMLPIPPLQLQENAKFKVGWGKHEYGEVILVSNVHRDNELYNGIYFRIDSIRKTQLDKKKVKEVLEKSYLTSKQYRILKKELGLE